MQLWPVVALSTIVLVVALYFADIDVAAASAALRDWFDRKTYEWFVEDCDPLTSAAGDMRHHDELKVGLHVVYPVATSFPGLLSSMLSLSHNLESPGECVIHIIVSESQFDAARRTADCFEVELDALAASPSVKIHMMRSVPFNFSNFSEVWRVNGFGRTSKWSPLDYALLYVPEYVLDASRVIWLSANSIVRADLSHLSRMPMSHAVAAARDMKSVTWRTEWSMLNDLDDSFLEHVPNKAGRLFNTGVLVLDLERWRADGLTAKLEAWVERLTGLGGVELAMNLQLLEEFDVIDWRWHVYVVPTPQLLNRCIDEARIFHWLGPVYPWSPDLSTEQRVLYEKLTGPSDFLQHCKWNASALMLDSDVDVAIPGI